MLYQVDSNKLLTLHTLSADQRPHTHPVMKENWDEVPVHAMKADREVMYFSSSS